MEPRIQYAKTEDGVSIAFWTMGEGKPLVWTPAGAVTDQQPTAKFPEIATWWERLTRGRMIVRYSMRGTGESQRDVADYSLDARLADLQAVVDRLELGSFSLWAGLQSAMTAIAYVARHPDRVSHLILWHGVAKGSDIERSRREQSLAELRDTDWELYTETMAHVELGWTDMDQAKSYAALTRESTTPEAMQAMNQETYGMDVSELLPKVRVPTLVLHRRQSRISLDVARGLASRIPNAQLVILEGSARPPFLGDSDAVVAAIDEFLGVATPEPTPTAATPSLPSGMTAILFLDIADSTALTTKLGDAAYREKERKLDTALRSAITEAGGTAVEGKVLGDGVMAVFTSARQAIDAAQRCRDLGNESGLPLHLGIHAGDVVREGNNVHGGAVQVAARVQGAAAPGEILVSDIVRGLARTSAGVAFEDRGEHALKGIDEPQRLFAVREAG